MDFEKLALDYHEREPRGKIGIELTKPLDSQDDLSIAYSPGVAGPCRMIEKDPHESFRYTARSNLVAVITDGTAVLGLGNIGPDAAKPVMEGKAMLFRKFGGVNAFDLEVRAESADHFISVVKSLEPTFGGINLEDIKAPECFYIEERLIEMMDIPVFHDDQHGTAIIAGAALLNALEITGRRIEEAQIVVCGGGAAAIACADLYVELGANIRHITMVDSRGVIYEGRKEGMNPYKQKYALSTNNRTLADAMKDKDVFIGVSAAGIVSQDMVRTMAKNPIIFAMANPNPEITPPEVKAARPDAIVATGRSDYPNQVNNLLGFPYIFRGALDVQARRINMTMKKAAVAALAGLAKTEVPASVQKVYEKEGKLAFGRNYLIPKPIDPRVLTHVAPEVARAAMETNVARVMLDIPTYIKTLEKMQQNSK